MILALISIACFSDHINSLQAMLIYARISNACGMDLLFVYRHHFVLISSEDSGIRTSFEVVCYSMVDIA